MGEVSAILLVGLGGGEVEGVMVSRQLTAELFGPQDVTARHYVAVADGFDPEAVVSELNLALLPNGGDAATFTTLVDENLAQQTAFYSVLQGFLGLGLLVGVAGLGVVMFRAVRERRREIGMLRAIGFPAGVVRGTFLFEAGLIALHRRPSLASRTNPARSSNPRR